jgi:hypothetical protein
LAKAVAFNALTTVERKPDTETYFADLARYYRELAQERQWMLATQDLKTLAPAVAAPA